MPASVVTFWSKVLEERAQRFNSGDLEAEPPIETAGTPVRAGEEVSRLIRDNGNVRTYFGSLISSTPIGGGRGSAPASHSWQMFDADGMAAVSLAEFSFSLGGMQVLRSLRTSSRSLGLLTLQAVDSNADVLSSPPTPVSAH